MADVLPPAPINEPPSSYGWVDWYLKLRVAINNASVVFWANINKTGSNLTDIVTRNHSSLQNIQGGIVNEAYHLTFAQASEAIRARSTRGVDTVDDIIIDLATKGLVLKDTQATPHYWRIKVSTTGVLTSTDLGTVKP